MAELDWSDLPDNPALAPEPVAKRIKLKLSRMDASLNTLQQLRAIGPLTASACVPITAQTHRCIYWLWESGNMHRGIQIDVVGGDVLGSFVQKSGIA